MAYAAPGHSYNVGTQADVGGAFSEHGIFRQMDLRTELPVGAEFTERQWDHSAQFNGTNMIRRHYWSALFDRFELPR